MDKEMLEQFGLLMTAIEQTRSEMKASEMKIMEQTRSEIKASETRTQAFIENAVNKRIDSLFDGYKLTHEKQYELEREMERTRDEMERKMSALEARLAVLEEKTA
ncbi:hypothetical protein U6B65_09460 [Oscillospiraceae bacterium MB08-C2-2]|nr:hypothetical protein U6B65_09460 [Oscillospiraceae bacterium MB08-C2-2]